MKNKLIKTAEAEWILPVEGKAPIKLIGTESIIKNLDDRCLQQAYNASQVHGVEQVIINPDAHAGYGVPVGSVIVTKDTIMPGPVGPDICCSMSYLQTDLSEEVIIDKRIRRALINAICERIPMGSNNRITKKGRITGLSDQFFYKVLTEGVSDSVLHTFNIPQHWAKRLETQCYGPSHTALTNRVNEFILPKSDFWLSKLKQLGSYGGGNHFGECEITRMNKEEKTTANVFGLQDGKVGFLSHCGSRGFGFNLAKYHFAALKAHFQKWGIPLPENDYELVYAPTDSELGQDYWLDMCLGANFAIINHLLINALVLEAFQEVIPGTKGELVYHIAHNIGQKEIIGGQERFVWRKGATRALPQHYFSLKDTRFYGTGHPILLPGNPHSGSYIMAALPEVQKAAYSINHGAGRQMGRKEAFRKLDQKQINSDFDSADILSNCRNYPVDEAPAAYKDFEEVMKSVTTAKLATPVAKLEAKFVIKDGDKDKEGSM